jgi:hypothetical protein
MTRNFVFIKSLRVAGWCLLALVPVYIVTGYIMAGEYGLGVLLPVETAKKIHQAFHLVLLAVVVAHAVPAVYFTFRRWRWVQTHKAGKTRKG